ncbi:MAG: NUDIX hydrolase N-terminal domain-containing protein [Candidatus Promineifilaceae bacterium]|nr:NUDIX hydrolase N-terminal domain-containing protein [Candidatus Promineifilaceae bacterium]
MDSIEVNASPAQKIALWADQLRDAAAMGLHFSDNIYEKERCRLTQSIAMKMMALAMGVTVDSLEPLRASVFAHPTPFSVVDTAVIDAHGRILLIKRADNKKWAMPGGALEVGETAAEGAVRETVEETGIKCRINALVGVFDSRFCGSTTAHHLYHFTFLASPVTTVDLGNGSHNHEIVDLAWFAGDDLPPGIDPGHVSRIPEAYRVWRGDERPFFDQPSNS